VSLLIFLAFVFTAIALSLHGIKKRRKESRAEQSEKRD
jgi:preprotein translocase subunit SecG